MLIGIIFASIVFGVYAFLCLSASDNAIEKLTNTQILLEQEKLEEVELQMTEMVEQFQESASSMSQSQVKKFKKKANSLKKKRNTIKSQLDKYEAAKISAFDVVSLAGYSVIELLKWDVNTPVLKRLIGKCQQLKKKDIAVMHAQYMVAQMFSLSLVGAIAGFALLSVGIANGMGTRALIVFLVPIALGVIVGYLPLDNVNSQVEKRKESIESDFPQVISKLALLAAAGLEVSKAWNLTLDSGEGALYDEMRIVSRDLANNVSPAEAYHRMHVKCNNTYVTKLCSAITQNMSKGNSEIVKYLKDLNDESWMERKHSSRRMAEKVQSRLLVPTLLMFAGILILVIVPVMSGFNMF